MVSRGERATKSVWDRMGRKVGEKTGEYSVQSWRREFHKAGGGQ